MEQITLAEQFAAFGEHVRPEVVAELNGRRLNRATLRGAFVWHHHEHEVELFLVHRGRFRMEFRDRTVQLAAGDVVVVPSGVEHRPVADEEVEILIFEPPSRGA